MRQLSNDTRGGAEFGCRPAGAQQRAVLRVVAGGYTTRHRQHNSEEHRSLQPLQSFVSKDRWAQQSSRGGALLMLGGGRSKGGDGRIREN